MMNQLLLWMFWGWTIFLLVVTTGMVIATPIVLKVPLTKHNIWFTLKESGICFFQVFKMFWLPVAVACFIAYNIP